MRSGSYRATTPALQDELRTSWSQVRSARHALQDVLRASWSHALSRCAGSGTVLSSVCSARYAARILVAYCVQAAIALRAAAFIGEAHLAPLA